MFHLLRYRSKLTLSVTDLLYSAKVTSQHENYWIIARGESF